MTSFFSRNKTFLDNFIMYNRSFGFFSLVFFQASFWILQLSTMGTPNDQAVLQAIFNPDTPFGDIVGLDTAEKRQSWDLVQVAGLQSLCS